MSDADAIQRTFVMLKPDALERGLVGEIIARIERADLRLVRMETRMISKELAAKHYSHLVQKPFYPEIEAYVTRGPVVASIWEGSDAVRLVRRLVGATDPAAAEPGTIRGDLAHSLTENLVHASDSPESAAEEIANFFPEA